MAGKRQKAEAILYKIGKGEYAKRTVNEISGSFAKAAVHHSYAALFARKVRPIVLIGIALAVFQQFCGINVVFNYTSTIFESLGATVNEQLFQTVAIGVVNLVFTIVAMWQVDRIGRRPLMLFGFAGLAIWYILLAFLLMTHASSGRVSLVVLAAIATYSVSLAPVTWVLIAEIFPNNIRGLASSLAIVSLWGAYFLLVFTFPVLAEKLGTYGPFWMYAGICLLGLLFIKTRVKESKGKTLEELEDLLVSH
jgi:MFS family permease